jgi:membrane-associated phospholipid phosphatase
MRRRHDTQEDPTAGLRIPVGFTLTAVLVLFAFVLEQVVAGGPMTDADRTVLSWIVHHRGPNLTDAFHSLTALGSAWVVGPVEAAAAVVLLARRRWQLGALVAMVPIVTFVLTGLVKLLVGRPRPSLDTRLVSVSGMAFPSGHASAAVACYLTLAVVFWAIRPPGWPRVAVTLGAVLVCLGIGASRIYLGVHWVSDVLGGWMLGAIVLLALTAEVSMWATRRRHDVQDLLAVATPN